MAHYNFSLAFIWNGLVLCISLLWLVPLSSPCPRCPSHPMPCHDLFCLQEYGREQRPNPKMRTIYQRLKIRKTLNIHFKVITFCFMYIISIKICICVYVLCFHCAWLHAKYKNKEKKKKTPRIKGNTAARKKIFWWCQHDKPNKVDVIKLTWLNCGIEWKIHLSRSILFTLSFNRIFFSLPTLFDSKSFLPRKSITYT